MDVAWKIEDSSPSSRPELTNALFRLVDPDGPAKNWRTPPTRIEIRRRLSGLGGATVLQIAAYWRREPTIRVIKFGPPAEMHREYHAYETVAAPELSALFVPVETATAAARQHEPPSRSDGLEAVVYQDVGQFDGAPGAPVTTLEDVFMAASLGDRAASARAATAIGSLLSRARRSIYLGPRSADQPTSLRARNVTLAPDITLEPGTAGPAYQQLWPEDLFQLGTADPEDSDPQHDTNLFRLEDVAVADRGSTIVAANPHEHVAALLVPPPAGTAIPSPVTGKLTETRLQTTRRRYGEALGEPEPSPVLRRALAALRPALSEIVLPEVTSAVHGDLNSRNILLVDALTESAPRLIDHARAEPKGSLLGDFVWLEINLVRSVRGEPGLAAHVRLQRFLAATSSLFVRATGDTLEPAPASLLDCLGSASAGLAACWPALHRLRWEAFLAYPPEGRQSWFADYQRHLVVAAHRTFKWPDEIQTPGRWIASTATAAVGGEWFAPSTALRDWAADEVAALAAAPSWLGRADAAGLLGTLSAEIDRRPELAARTAEALVAAANAVAGELVDRCPPPPTARPFLDLRAEVINEDGTTAERDSALAAVLGRDEVVLVGAYGSGKSTLLAEAADRLKAVAGRRGNATGTEWHRLPVLITAEDLPADARSIPEAVRIEFAPATAHDLLRAGCLQLLIDGTAGPEVDVLAYARGIRRRYPRTPVLITTRAVPEHRLGPAPAVIRLLAPTTAQSIAFLTEVAAHAGIPVSAVRRLLDAANVRRTVELLHVPLLLRMMSRHLQPATTPPGIGDLLDQHFADGGPDWDRARRVAGLLAAHLLDGNAGTVDEVLPLLDAVDSDGWPRVMRLLVERQVLHRTSGRLTFSRPVYRDYFAAVAAVGDEAALSGRARRRAWQEPLRIAVSRQATAPGLLAALLPVVDEADPVYAGRLLEAGAHVDPASAESFIARRAGVLADPEAGVVAAGRAATALLTMGDRGRRELRAVAADPRCDQHSRLAALSALSSTDRGRDELLGVLQDLLVDPRQPADLRVGAAAVAGHLGAAELSVVVADGCDTDMSWRYVQTARAALVSMPVALSPRLREVVRQAAVRRLTEAAGLVPGLTRWDEIDVVQRDREEILTRVLGDDVDRLIDHRFAYDLGEAVGDALDRVRGRARGDVAGLLDGTAGDEELFAVFGSGDDRLSTAAAHGLLTRYPERLPELVAAVTSTDRPARLRAAAGVAPRAGATCLPHLEDLARELAAGSPDSSRTEALAALIWAVFQLDEVRGAHLARSVRAALVATGGSRRLHWPVSTAIAKSSPRPGLWERLVTSPNADDRALGVEALASQGFHLDGSARSAVTLSRAAEQALRASRPAPEAGWTAVEFVRAAATARLVDALDLVEALLDRVEPDDQIRAVPHGRYGILTLAGRSEVLSAAGYLARAAFRSGHPDAVRAAIATADRIEQLDPAGAHPSVAAGRLIALGYLGNPVPILEHLDGAEPRLHTAAGHAVLRWADDGPFAGGPWRDAGPAADEVARLLRDRIGTGAARSTLLEVLAELSRRSGQLPAPPVTDRCG